jgi:hypothetical protein
MVGKEDRAKGPETDPLAPRTPEEKAFVEGLVARGEAVKIAPGGALPPGATHEIVGETETGAPIVKRRRFSIV